MLGLWRGKFADWAPTTTTSQAGTTPATLTRSTEHKPTGNLPWLVSLSYHNHLRFLFSSFDRRPGSSYMPHCRELPHYLSGAIISLHTVQVLAGTGTPMTSGTEPSESIPILSTSVILMASVAVCRGCCSLLCIRGLLSTEICCFSAKESLAQNGHTYAFVSI